MIRMHKGKAVLSSLLILLPLLFGLLLWDRLPNQLASHWGADGAVDGMAGRAFTVVTLPLVLLAFHWLCLLVSAAEFKKRGRNGKAMGLVFWIIPAVSLFSSGIIYGTAFGLELNPLRLTLAFIGLLFLILGNFLPKVEQNGVLGVRVSWTLNSEENWRRTHRFCGRLWVAGGLLLLLIVPLPVPLSTPFLFTLLLAATFVLSFLPILYSYRCYRRERREGTAAAPAAAPSRKALRISAVLGVLLAAAVVLLLFTGNVSVAFGADSFQIQASYWPDLEIDYAAVDALTYRDDCPAGVRVGGFGSFRLSLGSFRNDEFGNYTRYAYTACPACVAVEVDGRILALNGRDEAATRRIYEELLARIP